ncbi:ZIP family metal transporter [Metabacillus endolithicus]|uniref:ZIP family metal transporter n=1 Tax=Metabacillus endolithicus TaxID=1535204 RepID=UPI0031ECA4FC
MIYVPFAYRCFFHLYKHWSSPSFVYQKPFTQRKRCDISFYGWDHGCRFIIWLIPSAIKLSDITTLVIGILIGTLVLTLIESVIPHTDLDHSKHPVGQAHVLLFMIAMSIHNFPEELSVGISNVSSNLEIGSLVAFAIGLQNIPEGFLVALFLVTQGINRLKAIVFSAVTGLIELFAGMFGYLFGEFFQPVVPYGLAFAAGSMLFVVYKELIPESHGDGNERASTITFIFGFITMICLTEFFR